MDSFTQAVFYHPLQKRMIHFQKSLRIGADSLITPLAVGVFFIGGQAAAGFYFGFQNGRHQRMTFRDDFPDGVADASPEASLRNEKVVTFPVTFGQEGLPQGVDAMLAGKLTVVVGRSVQGDVGVGQVMADLGGEFEDAGGVMGFHGVYEVPEGFFQMPGEEAMGGEGVQRVFFNGLLPAVWEGRFVAVQVNVMPGGLPGEGAAAFVGLGGLLGKIFNLRAVEGKERFRQGKDSQAVDPAVRPKAPGVCGSY
jgi:hypothetical protein